MRLGIIVAAWGRPEPFRNHLAALIESSGGLSVDYSLGALASDKESKSLEILRCVGWPQSATITPVDTVKRWPLPLAYNAALRASEDDIVVVVGADVIVPPGLLRDALTVADGKARLYSTHDTSGRVFVGPERMLAFPYCMAIHRQRLVDIGGWDEAFADGICYDDTDLSARLLISGVRFEWCGDFVCKHQQHPRYHGYKQGKYSARNKKLWEERLNGYKGPLWPVTQARKPKDTDAAQDALAEGLKAHGYNHVC